MAAGALDPELESLTGLFPPLLLTAETLPAARAGLLAAMAARTAADGLPAPEIHIAPGRDGAPGVPLHLYRPATAAARPRAALLHMHGGAMVLGSAAMATASLVPLVTALDVVAISIEYRLAPETPFPGPQEDCYAGLVWLLDHAGALGIDPARIVLMGESAGGGLAAALALMARDRGLPSPAGQALLYPMLDHRTGGPDDAWRNPVAGRLVCTAQQVRFGWDSLRGDYDGADAREGWFSPALAADLTGLPPTFIAVGGLDLFVDENLDYARRLTAAGVPVECQLYPSAPHAFNAVPEARVSRQAAAAWTAAIARLAAPR